VTFPPGRPPIEHDWEEVPLVPEETKVLELEVPSREDPGLLQHAQITLNLSYAYAEKVKEGPKGDGTDDEYARITSLRRCRACLQESVNGREPEEECGLRQVRRVMTE
jgi:hypothetical protein